MINKTPFPANAIPGVSHIRVHSSRNPEGEIFPLENHEKLGIVYKKNGIYNAYRHKDNALTRKSMRANGVVYTKPFAKATEQQVSKLAHLCNRGGIMPYSKRRRIKHDIEISRSQF